MHRPLHFNHQTRGLHTEGIALMQKTSAKRFFSSPRTEFANAGSPRALSPTSLCHKTFYAGHLRGGPAGAPSSNNEQPWAYNGWRREMTRTVFERNAEYSRRIQCQLGQERPLCWQLPSRN